MVVKRIFGKHFRSSGGALTLNPEEVCKDRGIQSGTHSRRHADGWTITGEIHEYYFVWVNEFKATHPVLGKVWGNFETTVYASSKKAFDHFFKHHTPHAWDYGDI